MMESSSRCRKKDDAEKARKKALRQVHKIEKGLPAGRHGARNEKRAAVFVRWLVETYGLERLRRSGVVDVAGGKGEIAARLAHCHGVRCLVMDPRTGSVEETFLKKVAPRLPGKWRESIEKAGNKSDRIRSLVKVVRREFDDSFMVSEILKETRFLAAVFVGMHADGATEAIVDFALKNDRSFAVVPCCVFAKRQQKFLPGMKPMTYEQFAEALVEKNNFLIRKKILNFDGRNECIFSILPESLSPAEAMEFNEPLLLRNYVQSWPAIQKWTDNGRLNRRKMATCFPAEKAPVYNNDKSTLWKVSDFLLDDDQWQSLSYLKDWHLDSNDFSTPPDFDRDWLGAWCEAVGKEAFTFCYVGPRNSSTPEHSDVLASFSWSANVAGTKRWRLQRAHSQTEFSKDETLMTIEQRQGDLVFVPSDWRHDVVNADHCVSINRNWFNSYSIERVALYIDERRKAVIQELDSWGELSPSSSEKKMWTIENVLSIDARLNFSNFLALIHYNSHEDTRHADRILALCDGLLQERLDENSLFLSSSTKAPLVVFPTDDAPDSWSFDARNCAGNILHETRQRAAASSLLLHEKKNE